MSSTTLSVPPWAGPCRVLRWRRGRALAAVVATACLSPGFASPADAASATYSVVESKSSVRIHVGKSGLFSFAGHRHEVEAPVSGTVTADPSHLESSSVDLSFAALRLRVREEGEPKGDAAKVQEKMHGPDVLDAVRFPEIRFKTKRVSGKARSNGGYELRLVGELSLRGTTLEITLPVEVTLVGPSLTATGKATLRHDQFGMKPVSVGGVVKVANEIPIDFVIVAELQ